MSVELIGPHPFATDAAGQPLTRMGTLFPEHNVLFTRPPCVHAWQRLGFVEHMNEGRAAKGLAPLSIEEEERLAMNSVDLIFESDHILIRPDPECLELAFQADELLQTIVSKRQVKFLSVSDLRVREAIKRRGELWRLGGLPKTQDAKAKLILGSKVSIHGLPIYYYNRLTGTRWLTCQEFAGLGRLDDAGLARHLQEIAEHAVRRNRLGRPEIDFFATDLRKFGTKDLSDVVFTQISSESLRKNFAELEARFRSAVLESFGQDNPLNKSWSERMLATLFLDGNESESEQLLAGLSPEFYMQVEWLAGGRFEEGEFLLDSVFDEAAAHPEDRALQRLCDPRAKDIIFNIVRDIDDLEYINLGMVPESLSISRPQKEGRRGVYLMEFRARGDASPTKRFMRLQKWSVWEHLDAGKDLLSAIQDSDEYTDYWLDRRLGCRQLGMNLCRRVFMRRLSEKYHGKNIHYRGARIRTTYFERDYVPGIATDKLSQDHYGRAGYALKLAALLGRAAASNLIVGRTFDNQRLAFDDGDEVVCEDEQNMPAELLIGDHNGAFTSYMDPLDKFAAECARPVNRREAIVPNAREFALAYLDGFREQLTHIQDDYRKRRRAFDNLFEDSPYDVGGSYSYRWECVLKRLDQTNADELIDAIREHIHVLSHAREPVAA